MPVSSRREQLIETALDLFSRRGFQAVGIDRLLAEAGVAKMTLYKHFRSKDELIREVLRRRDARWHDWFWGAVASKGTDPRSRLLAVFDVLAEWFVDPAFNGCLFIRAAAEFAGADEPCRKVAAEHQKRIADGLRALAAEAGATDPEELSRALIVLVEGAVVVAQVCQRPDAAADARRAAEVLLAAHLPGAGS